MLTGFSTQPIAGSFVDTRGQKYPTKTIWTRENQITSTWIAESLNWWDSILTENSDFLLTENNEILITEQKTFLTWAKETIGSTTWTKENI
ncbi:MAG: hypothetical protein KatS3mg096_745 [Candidatus Parcubacteria bacterium]|nr:MAG: hypothetical protein KatS3mg096_745 [Candidatus Parcubacteria bacterium]